MAMDFAAVNSFARQVVQPSLANRDTLGVRPVTDLREAAMPATALAAKNSADLRVSTGPRQSSSAADTRQDDGHNGLKVRNRAQRQPSTEGGEDRGSSVDVTI
jgi:hypothetical protein